MIRHRPFGSGHPYSVDTDQRHPVDPVAGETLNLGVRSSAGVARVDLELVRDGGAPAVLPLAPVTRRDRGQVVDGGHLASAQARLARASGGWNAELDDLRVGETLRYRFVAPDERTRWFETTVTRLDRRGTRTRPGRRAARGRGVCALARRRLAGAPHPLRHSAGARGAGRGVR